MPVAPIPAGYHTVTPYLIVKGIAEVIAFLERAFDARVVHQMKKSDGTIGHTDVVVGDSHLMMAEACEGYGSMPAGFYLYVPDTDAAYHRALAAGAASVMPPADQFYGDRNAGVKDAAGNLWWIATHIEDVPPDELHRRAVAAGKSSS